MAVTLQHQFEHPIKTVLEIDAPNVGTLGCYFLDPTIITFFRGLLTLIFAGNVDKRAFCPNWDHMPLSHVYRSMTGPQRTACVCRVARAGSVRSD